MGRPHWPAHIPLYTAEPAALGAPPEAIGVEIRLSAGLCRTCTAPLCSAHGKDPLKHRDVLIPVLSIIPATVSMKGILSGCVGVDSCVADIAKRHINGVYTQVFNRRHGKVGHLFQGR